MGQVTVQMAQMATWLVAKKRCMVAGTLIGHHASLRDSLALTLTAARS